MITTSRDARDAPLFTFGRGDTVTNRETFISHEVLIPSGTSGVFDKVLADGRILVEFPGHTYEGTDGSRVTIMQAFTPRQLRAAPISVPVSIW